MIGHDEAARAMESAHWEAFTGTVIGDLREEACALLNAAVPVALVDEGEPDHYLVPASFVHRLSAAIVEYQRREDMAVAAWERALEPGGVR